ncbi:guanitoxin biosynthesis L-enduracididine beta-hydroxylase GntD [Marinobacter sp. NFXS9]|uniref:guanitoxin biosynthesis L-enduracididine beta-hydroxylase GntD n=1 Tax=Marinobacter sp. NFXS9 TaxID=2818433 RepID=UPI0032DEBC63
MDNCIVLNEREIEQINRLTSRLSQNFAGFDNEDFLKDLPVSAYRLPERLVRFINSFKYDPPQEGYAVISTGMVNDYILSKTPPHWQLDTNNTSCEAQVLTICLCATVLGDLFGWFTQQDGRIVHDILPIRQNEFEQLGSGSGTELTLHTEDAFHEYRGDYLVMMCLRNPDSIPTTIAKPDYESLTDEEVDVLFEEHFVIKPDNSHKPAYSSDKRYVDLASANNDKLVYAYSHIEELVSRPKKVAVLYGHRDRPYLRLDPYFMEEPDNSEAKLALRKLVALVEESMVEVTLKPGEILLIDNYEVVHGRRRFAARYDGTDRWFKRVNVTRDIRKCRSLLERNSSRVIT